MSLPKNYTKAEAVAWLRCSTRTIERAVKAGELVGYRIGAEILFDEAELLRFRDSRKIKPAVKLGRPRRALQIVSGPR